jgi:beta-lactamase regulating signal transducer with metallopeptidase domain
MTALELLLRQPWIAPLGWALLHFLWQGAALVALLVLLLRLPAARKPQARYMAACLALGVMAACPIGSLIAVGRTPTITPPATVVVDRLADLSTAPFPRLDHSSLPPSSEKRSGPRGSAPAVEPILPALVALWFAGVCVLSVRLLGGWVTAQQLPRRGAKSIEGALRVRLAELAHRMGVVRPVCLLASTVVSVPTVVGWLRAAILVPAGALSGLPPGQLEALLAHELAHIRRHDYLVNLLQAVVETVLFYHPAVWWVSRQIRIEREHCCDDLAVALLGDRRAYARALTALEALRAATSPPALAGNGGDLLARIRRILGLPPQPAGPTATGIGGMIVLTLILAAVVAVQVSAADRPASKAASLPASLALSRTPHAPAAVTPTDGAPAAGTRAVSPQKVEAQMERELRRLIQVRANIAALQHHVAAEEEMFQLEAARLDRERQALKRREEALARSGKRVEAQLISREQRLAAMDRDFARAQTALRARRLQLTNQQAQLDRRIQELRRRLAARRQQGQLAPDGPERRALAFLEAERARRSSRNVAHQIRPIARVRDASGRTMTYVDFGNGVLAGFPDRRAPNPQQPPILLAAKSATPERRTQAPPTRLAQAEPRPTNKESGDAAKGGGVRVAGGGNVVIKGVPQAKIEDVAVLDLRGVAANEVGKIESIEDVAVIILDERNRQALKPKTMSDVGSTIVAPRDARVIVDPLWDVSKATLDAMPKAQKLICVGVVYFRSDVTPALVREKIASLQGSGVLLAPAGVRGALVGISELAGASATLPDDAGPAVHAVGFNQITPGYLERLQDRSVYVGIGATQIAPDVTEELLSRKIATYINVGATTGPKALVDFIKSRAAVNLGVIHAGDDDDDEKDEDKDEEKPKGTTP